MSGKDLFAAGKIQQTWGKLTDLGPVVGWCGVGCVSLCFRVPAHGPMPKVENL